MGLTFLSTILLLKDLCARLPYGVIVNIPHDYYDELKAYIKAINPEREIIYYEICGSSTPLFDRNILGIKPYLRSMSSMTEEEKQNLLNLLFDKEAKYFYIDDEGFIDGKTSNLMKEGLNYPAFCTINVNLYTDWLNANHFDYRGLILKALAIEVTKENNPYEEINL